MKKVLIIFVLLSVVLSVKCLTTEILCETIEVESDWPTLVKLCNMTKTTSIPSKDYTISSEADASMGIIRFDNNKKISYLPIKISEKFSNVNKIYASSCSIKEVSKENFKGLSKLKVLFLGNNEITKITKNTFQGLTSLGKLGLNQNRIQFMNGDTFRGLNRLEMVWLYSNSCIDEYVLKDKVSTLPQLVTEKCGFNETEAIN